MIQIHKKYQSLISGSLKFLHADYKCIAYGRFTFEEAVVVVLNNDYADKEVKINVRQLGVRNKRNMKRVILTTEDGFVQDDQTCTVMDSVINVTLPKLSAAVYVCKLV